ncbi:hypothetical protein F4805DRAFT_461050 [Annulohypoxylon moriforme]|nr:hypothetical protein F4805DRAFT_461050 [Annulohypoxylon moriforme]
MDDSEDTAAAMAEAMGFSSFGSQNANKRRKFNPNADEAFVASTSTSTIPLHQGGGVREAKSGSNATPLGVRTQNKDEIDLEDDDDEPEVLHNEVHHSLSNSNDGNLGPQYMDTSRPPTAITTEPTDDIQSKIDSITGIPSNQWGAQSSASNIDGGASYRGGYGRGGHQPNRGRGRGKGRGRGGGQGHESGKNWWEGYYDPTTNTNPWGSLEKTNGLEPLGSWMSWEEARSRSGQTPVA